jgi:hypothetical protein
MADERRAFPAHGKVNCSLCFPVPGGTISSGKWSFHNDPGHWGSSTPTILVLGFSKGPTQKAAYSRRTFEDVAFAGIRHRLQIILATLGIVSKEEDFNRRFQAIESSLAFASLIRCTVELPDAPPKESGNLMLKVFRDPEPRHLLENCANRFLRYLPSELKLVVMLGAQDGYIKRCRRLIGAMYGAEYRYINPVAYSTGQVTWVHATHPSRQNGHFNQWVDGAESASKLTKGYLAKEAIRGIPGLAAGHSGV